MTWQIGRYAPPEYSQGKLLDKSPLLFWFNHFVAEYFFFPEGRVLNKGHTKDFFIDSVEWP